MIEKDDRLYAKFTLDFADTAKIAGLSDAAFRALVEMTLHSRKLLTDGLIEDGIAKRRNWRPKVLKELSSNDPEKPSLIPVEGGHVIHDFKKHQDTRAEVEERRKRNAENGRKGGLAKSKRVAKRPASDSLSDSSSENVAETETETTSSNELVINTATFDDFWAVWPRSEGKVAAVKAWDKATRKADAEAIVTAARALAESPYRPEKQFIPHGATWLNGERWNDPPPEPPEHRAAPTKTTAAERALALSEKLRRQEHDAAIASQRSLG